MQLHPLLVHEWCEDGGLSRRSIIWIEEHAEPGDHHPIATAVAQLRAIDAGGLLQMQQQPPQSLSNWGLESPYDDLDD